LWTERPSRCRSGTGFDDIDDSEPIEFLGVEPSEEEIKRFLIDRALDIGM